MQRSSSSMSASLNKFDRSRRGMKIETGDSYTSFGNNRPATPGQNVLARPPSTLSVFNQMPGGSRLTTMSSSSSGYVNVGLPISSQIGINILERPITQHGVAGVRPGTEKGLSMTRQIQDKRYYAGLMQLKIRDLSQEIAIIMKDIEDQTKERATYLHYDKRVKDLAAELTALQGQLADYNIVVDKMTSDIGKEIIEEESRELITKNEHSLLKIENMFEKRKELEQQLHKIEKQLETEKLKTERLIENMDLNTKEKYDELSREKTTLQSKINKIQEELDELSKEQIYLEEEIALSPLKQEVFKLHLKIIEAEEKKVKLQEEEKNRISPEEEKEKLLQKIKQHNVDIAAAEAQLAERKKKMEEVEQELEQLETDIEDTQSEKQIKYKELRKREEVMEQFMTSFNQNKEDETKKLHKLEETIVEHLQNISSMLNIDIDFSGDDEMAILNSIPPYNDYDYVNNDNSFEGLSKENKKLQQVLSKMKILEQQLKVECTNLTEKVNFKGNKLMALEDIDNLKTKLALKEEQLVEMAKELKKQESENGEELRSIQLEHDEIKQWLENTEVYPQINILQNTMEKLIEEHKKIDDLITDQKKRCNYGPVKESVLSSVNNYNSMIKENLKLVY